jgi:hypothetical protein
VRVLFTEHEGDFAFAVQIAITDFDQSIVRLARAEGCSVNAEEGESARTREKLGDELTLWRTSKRWIGSGYRKRTIRSQKERPYLFYLRDPPVKPNKGLAIAQWRTRY